VHFIIIEEKFAHIRNYLLSFVMISQILSEL